MLVIMSTVNEWDFTVPDDNELAAELVAELRRHGVRAGQRLHMAVADPEVADDATVKAPAFFGSFSGPGDLAERSDAILRAEFPFHP